MAVKRMDNVGIVVEDIDAAIEFFVELGLTLEGRMPVDGEWAGRVTGLRGRLVNVYTDPAWRRQGVARGLVQEVMRRCQKRDVQVFNLAATDDSAALYRSIGFVPYATEMILRP